MLKQAKEAGEAQERLMSKKTRTCRVTLSEVADMVDAIFIGNRDEHGWVTMWANAKGCGCINALFPQDEIEWYDDRTPQVPCDWHNCELNVPEAALTMENRLPLEITMDADLDAATPDALAFLLACGVKRQGGRSAVYFDRAARVEIYGASTN